MPELTKEQLAALDNLSPEEKATAIKILKEYAENGSSELLDEIKYEEYKERPVDIETFLTNDNYLGKAWKDAGGNLKIYPFWMEQLKKMFPTNLDTQYATLLESGARGIGKSEVACGAVGAYLMYRVMCMKNPLEFYRLKPTEKICFAFMNIKLALAEEIAISKFQKTIQMSPWFMSRGSMTQRNNQPYWVPPEPISIIIGSQSDDVIGKPIYYCLDGQTPIITDQGIYNISELENKDIKVYSIADNGNIILSDTCTVKQTAESTEEYQIELEDGSTIKCTPNHRFKLKDGSYKEAQYLTEDDELMDISNMNTDDIKLSYYGYIYKFTMLPTNKIYVGKREKSKFDESYYGSGREWKKDLAKYGKDLVKREILDWGLDRQELREKEIYWINKLDATNSSIGYNIHKGGAGGNSLNNKDAWSELHKGNKNGRYGKPVSQETRDLISKSNKGKIRSQKFKDNLSLKTKGKKKPNGFGEKLSKTTKGRKNEWLYKKVICVETNIIYESSIHAEAATNICQQNIRRACKYTHYTAGGYHWRYINEN